MNDLVSVIIPTYNRLKLIKSALKSVQKQSYQNIEIIVVDASKNDETKHYISQYDDIIYATSDTNHANALRNLGLELSNGQFIAFLDDDDTWEKNKIIKQLQCFQNNNIGLCYTGKNITDEKGKLIKYSYKFGKFNSHIKSIMWDNFIGSTSSIMIKKNIIKKIGNFDENLPALQDYDLCIRICAQFKVQGINEALTNYRYNHSKLQISEIKENFNLSSKIIRKKYSHLPNSFLLRLGLFQQKLKRRIKNIYE